MRIVKITLASLMIGCGAIAFGQSQEVKMDGQWEGSITYTGWYAQTKAYNVNFANNDGGGTQTEWDNGHMEPCRFKAEILESGKVKITEYPNVKETRASLCYFTAELDHKIVGNQQYLTGDFTSKYANGNSCYFKGNITLAQPYYPEEIAVDQSSPYTAAEQVAINNSQIKAYPNPTNGVINLDFVQAQFNSDRINIQVMDPSGKMILDQQINSSRTQVDLTAYENGIYMVKVMDDGELYSQKRIILSK